MLVLLVLVVCGVLLCCCCCRKSSLEYNTGNEYRVTVQQWNDRNAAHYTVARADSISSRGSSIRSSLGLRPKVRRGSARKGQGASGNGYSEVYHNTGAPGIFSTPL